MERSALLYKIGFTGESFRNRSLTSQFLFTIIANTWTRYSPVNQQLGAFLMVCLFPFSKNSFFFFSGLLSDTVETNVPLSSFEHGPVISPFTAWNNFGDCSVSCGKGTKKRVVKCQPKGNERNQNCPPGTETYTERIPCTKPSCPGNSGNIVLLKSFLLLVVKPSKLLFRDGKHTP